MIISDKNIKRHMLSSDIADGRTYDRSVVAAGFRIGFVHNGNHVANGAPIKDLDIFD